MRIAPHRAPQPLLPAAPLLAAVLLAACTGCSSGSSTASAQLDALRHLPAAENTGRQVTYVDEAEMRKLEKGDSQRYRQISQPASGLLIGYMGVPWGDTVKTDQIDSAIDANQVGHWDGRFDPAAVAKELKKHHFTSKEQDGKTVLTSESGSLKIAVSDSELVYSTEGAKHFSPGDPDEDASLAGVEEYRQIADCLGDVYRADYNTLSTKKSVRLSALGQHDDSGRNTEVMCLVVKDKAAADEVASKLRARIKERGQKFGGAKVDTADGDHPVVRVTVPDSGKQKPGRLFISDVDLWMALGSD
jgi:hypothetical protein